MTISPIEFFGIISRMALASLAVATLIGVVAYFLVVPIMSRLHGHSDEARSKLSQLVPTLSISAAPPNVIVPTMAPVIEQMGVLSEMQLTLIVWDALIVVLFYGLSWTLGKADDDDEGDGETMRERRERIRKGLQAEEVPDEKVWKPEQGESE